MAALKGQAVERYVSHPATSDRFILVYGPDTGLANERARAIANNLAGALGGEVEPFDADTTETGALFDSATSISLFGGQQVIHVRPTARQLAAVISDILASDDPAPLVVEAGDLKPSSPLRKLAEKGARAVALPCYQDTPRETAAVIDGMVADAGLRIDVDARTALVDLLGGDRIATRSEIAKLCDYCADESVIRVEDVLAICQDASLVLLDEAADAVGLGDMATADSVLARCQSSGIAIQSMLAALARHFRQLRHARIAVENGTTAEAAMRAVRPPVFFKRQATFRRQLAAWPLAKIDHALLRILTAEAETRTAPDLATETMGRLAFSLAAAARRR